MLLPQEPERLTVTHSTDSLRYLLYGYTITTKASYPMDLPTTLDPRALRIIAAQHRGYAQLADKAADALEAAATPSTETIVNDAFVDGRWIRIRYQGADDTRPHWRLVKPTSAVHRALGTGHSFFRAFDGAASDTRCFRIERVTDAIRG